MLLKWSTQCIIPYTYLSAVVELMEQLTEKETELVRLDAELCDLSQFKVLQQPLQCLKNSLSLVQSVLGVIYPVLIQLSTC